MGSGLWGLRIAAIAAASVAMLAGVGTSAQEDIPAQNDTQTKEEAPGWSAHGSVTLKSGTERQIGEMDFFIPLWQDAGSMVFADLRVQSDHTGNYETNAGAGYRRMIDQWIVGGYGFFDYRKSERTGNGYVQGTLGVEAFTESLDLRANAYIPESTEHATPTGTTLEQVGGSLQIKDGLDAERALPGMDVEVGYRLWGSESGDIEVRAFAGGFYFGADGYDTVAGPRGRVETRFFDIGFLGEGSRVMLGGEIMHDGVRDTQGFATARLTIPFGGGRRSARGGLSRRMTDYVVRDVDIVTGRAEPYTAEPVEYVDTGIKVGALSELDKADDIVAVANAGGTGDLIALDGSAGNFNTTAPMVMKPGQTLLGGGRSIDVVGQRTGRRMTYTAPGARPTINGNVAGSTIFPTASDTAMIALADDTMVIGLDVENLSTGNYSDGIAGIAVSGTYLIDNNITINGQSSTSLAYHQSALNTVTGNSIHVNGGSASNALWLSESSGNVVDGNGITASGASTRALYMSDNADNNTVRSNNIWTTGDNAEAMLLSASNNNTVEGNVVTTYGIMAHAMVGDAVFGTYAANNYFRAYGSSSSALSFQQSTDNTITGNTISAYGHNSSGALWFSESSDNVVDGNTIGARRATSKALYLSNNSDNNAIDSNYILTIELGSDAVWVDNGSDGNLVSDNRISAGGVGISVLSASNFNTFSRNSITTTGDNSDGMVISASDNNTINGNSITTVGSTARGISVLNGSTFNTISSNSILTTGDYAVGMVIRDSDDNMIVGNTITTGGLQARGITVSGGSTSNAFDGNSIITAGDNAEGMYIVMSNSNSVDGNTIRTYGTEAHGIDVGWVSGVDVIYNDIITEGWASSGLVLRLSTLGFISSNSITVNAAAYIPGGWAKPNGLTLSESSGNTVSGNIITANGYLYDAVGLSRSDNNQISRNTIVATGFTGSGISLSGASDGNLIAENQISTTGGIGYGLYFTSFSDLNTVNDNIISTTNTNSGGMFIFASNNNTFGSNTVTTLGSTAHGVDLIESAGNSFQNNMLETSTANSNGFNLLEFGIVVENNTGTGNSYTGPGADCIVDASVTGTNTIDLCP